MTTPSPFQYGGVRALVELHEVHLREFLGTWQRAKGVGVTLPETSDPDYNSLEHVLRHTLGAAAGYLRWICSQLELPDPNMNPIPVLAEIEHAAPAYLEHVIERWQGPLLDVTESQCEPQTYPASWGTHYCIDAMLEHAVMHPIRHSHQLKRLMA